MEDRDEARRVEAGAAFLDQYWGTPRWAMSIDTQTLTLDTSVDCPLGQLFGGFGNGLAAMDILDVDRQDVDLGFFWSTTGKDGQEARFEEVDRLNAEWRRVVHLRQALVGL